MFSCISIFCTLFYGMKTEKKKQRLTWYQSMFLGFLFFDQARVQTLLGIHG